MTLAGNLKFMHPRLEFAALLADEPDEIAGDCKINGPHHVKARHPVGYRDYRQVERDAAQRHLDGAAEPRADADSDNREHEEHIGWTGLAFGQERYRRSKDEIQSR